MEIRDGILDTADNLMIHENIFTLQMFLTLSKTPKMKG
jgi:hypothetical protein